MGSKKEKRMVVVTTDSTRRGVFFGELVDRVSDSVVRLKDAQMCIYWPVETHGVLGLASRGPGRGAKVSPQIPKIEINGVTAIMDATDDAVLAWRVEPWR